MLERWCSLLAAATLALPVVGAAEAAPPAAARGKTEITWYSHSAFVMRTPGGTVLAIDPWFKSAPQRLSASPGALAAARS